MLEQLVADETMEATTYPALVVGGS